MKRSTTIGTEARAVIYNLPPPDDTIPPSGHALKHRYFTRTAKGTEEVLPPTKTKLFRTKAEGRNRQVMPTHARKVPLTTKIWTSDQILNHFRNHKIHPSKDTHRWFVHFNNPNRKMTDSDMIELLLQLPYTPHLVHSNMNYRHFIIETLAGNETEL